jgi:uncharacterized membrane protein
MIVHVAAYLAALGIFVLADMIWLGTMASRLYRQTLGDILLSGVNVPPAIAFYVLYPIGLVVFAILPALKSGNITTALLYGSLFGFFTYATYDLTSHATLRNWTLQLTLIDVAWGTALAAAAAAAGFWVASKMGGVG